MNADEGDLIESVSQDENTLDGGQQITPRRSRVLGILIAAIIVAELTKDAIFSTDRGNWLPACAFLYYGLIAGLPFLLATVAPKAAGFHTQWLPSSRWHWAWFLGMVVLLFASKVLVCALVADIVGPPSPWPFGGPVTPTGIVLQGIAIIFIGPVAEEIFFRGFVLEQLRKLAHSGVALLIQSLLFGLYHLYTWGPFTSLALFGVVNTFFWAMILGAWRIKFRSILPLVLAHILLNAAGSIVPLKARYDQVTGKRGPIRHTISQETTYITEPLRKDGSVDYVAALNERFSQGVTPKNNAAVLFWKAVGPEDILPEYRKKYFQMLGIPPLPEKGDYFVDHVDYAVRHENREESPDGKPEAAAQGSTWDQLAVATSRPWSQEEFPVLAEWLAANEKPLALVVEASERPRRYDPLCCGERTPLIAVPLPAVYQYRETARALEARGMLRLNEGKVDEAWKDLLACHRFARLGSQGQTFVDLFIAVGIEDTVCTVDAALLHHAHLTAPQAAKMRQDLIRLPKMAKVADRVNVADRFTYLDCMSDNSSQGVGSLAWLDGLPGLEGLGDTIKLLTHHGASTKIDWDLILRMGNSWFDRIADGYSRPTRAEQREALSKLDEDFRRLKKAAADAKSLEKRMLKNPRQALSERVSQVFLIMFAPDTSLYQDVEDRSITRFELAKLGFALAAYSADHGAHPARLANLVPHYIVEVPNDIFNDSELHYRLEGKGYLLYSVGINGKDDGAKSYEDRKKDEDWDDLSSSPGGLHPRALPEPSLKEFCVSRAPWRVFVRTFYVSRQTGLSLVFLVLVYWVKMCS